MTTENQGFEVINDFRASGEVNLEQYLSQPYVLYKHADASRKLQRCTIDILEFSSYLKEQNRVMKRKNYKELVVSLGLEGEDRNYIKVGATRYAQIQNSKFKIQNGKVLLFNGKIVLNSW